MLLRAAVLYILFVVATMSGGIAVWQSLEVHATNERLAESSKTLTDARHELQTAVDESLAVARRARIAEHDLELLRQSHSAEAAQLEALRASLAAARQQASVAETAMTEAEDRLVIEIAAHANLKAEAEGVRQQLQHTVKEAQATAAAPRQDEMATDTKLPAGHAETFVAAPPDEKSAPEVPPIDVSLQNAGPLQSPASIAVPAVNTPHSEAVGAAPDDVKPAGTIPGVKGTVVEGKVLARKPVTDAQNGKKPFIKRIAKRPARQPAKPSVSVSSFPYF